MLKAILYIFRFIGTMNFVRWGLRYRLFQKLPTSDLEFSVPFFGHTYQGNLNNAIDRGVFFWGAHEREFLVYMGSCIPHGGIVLDIGGNVGHHSLYFSTRAAHVHAFEPFAPVADIFERRMQENGVTNVSLHRVGLGQQDTETTFYCPTEENLGTGSFVENVQTDHSATQSLRVAQGDAVVISLILDRVDFIKIDTEGYEREVLFGLRETLKKFRPIVELEFRTDAFTSEEDFQSAIEGYTPYLLQTNKKRFFLGNDPSVKLLPFRYDIQKAEVVLKPKN